VWLCSFRKYASTDHSKTFNSSRRSNNSSLCLGDFINTSLKSSHKKNNTSGPSPNASVDKTKTFDRPANNKQQVASQTVVAAKPKRRVVPHTISKVTSGRNEFTSSSFRADNNLSNFMIEETEPGQESARDFIRQQRDSISRDFLDEQVPYKGLHASVKDAIGDRPRETVSVDLGQITGQCQLERLARIYSVIIDMNLTTNILTEISFLINLLNAEVLDQPTTGVDAKLFDLQTMLKNFNNCVFFVLETLMCQRRLLAALDATTIRVLLENERLVTLKQQLIDFLRSTHTNKLRLESISGSAGEQFNKNNVFYQQESDTRDNFPSEQSFTAFRKQRDMFYSILR
jgi:codanin-1